MLPRVYDDHLSTRSTNMLLWNWSCVSSSRKMSRGGFLREHWSCGWLFWCNCSTKTESVIIHYGIDFKFSLFVLESSRRAVSVHIKIKPVYILSIGWVSESPVRVQDIFILIVTGANLLSLRYRAVCFNRLAKSANEVFTEETVTTTD